ncbi:amino acid/amide ABC transporter ATP-binding protein 1, HAAT family [Tistlia consotensis]|uniref:Amino acid/amide ABC transporter ATP-binding protein 1, HAAT family n=1 Tax=Tistlia consotensis USBA 355 TaxID=560819 RepID=A0A1Y6BLP0_9PROT|nr:ABC transporter ATP-binding protein [Tistlia consotensis]SMF17600.1 amino acid/amide ABC transporter ATP-binding protein 1, HAAT family [Tistlia consotensis USBA 355]SNR40314.1 amino acid/amide ABC transporter ATP-binding protein 1, HAAT family [Tistlia consotensis]
MTAVLEVEGLHKTFGGLVAVEAASFSVEAGRLFAIIGPNGAGKSTCFNMVGGQLRPDRGAVRLAGRDITGEPPRRIWRLGVGRTFQVAAAFGSMTVAENVQMAFLSHRRRIRALLPPARRLYREEALAVLDRVGMAGQADRQCGQLAYGDIKRVELAVALAHRPKLLLMDEPTAGMAPRERVELMALTAGIVRESGISVLFTEHDMDVVFAHADRLLVLDRGRMVAEGTPAEVRDNPEVQRIYLGGAGAEAALRQIEARQGTRGEARP